MVQIADLDENQLPMGGGISDEHDPHVVSSIPLPIQGGLPAPHVIPSPTIAAPAPSVLNPQRMKNEAGRMVLEYFWKKIRCAIEFHSCEQLVQDRKALDIFLGQMREYGHDTTVLERKLYGFFDGAEAYWNFQAKDAQKGSLESAEADLVGAESQRHSCVHDANALELKLGSLTAKRVELER